MNELHIDKTHWKRTKIGDLLYKTEYNDKENASKQYSKFIKMEHLDANSLNIHRCGDSSVEDIPPTFYKIFKKRQILYPTRNPQLRRAALASFDGICGEKTLTLSLIEGCEGYIPFIAHVFHSSKFIEYATNARIGSTNPHIRWRDVADYEFLLPPKAEQKRLAELLWAADEVVEKEKREREKMEEYRKLTFEQLTSKQANAKLSDCLIVNKKKSKAPHDFDKYIGLEHIESGAYTTTQYGNPQDVLADSYIFKKGDLLYSKLRPYLDKCIISDFDGICSTEIIVYDTKPNTSKEYILNVLHSKAFLDYIVDKSFGTKMPRVSHELVSDYELYLPSKKEQDEILTIIGNIINQEKRIREQIAISQQIKQELINKMF